MEDQGAGLSPPPPSRAASPSRSRGAKVAVVIASVTLLALLGACGVCVLAVTLADGGWPVGGADAVALIHLDGAIAGTGSSGTATPEEFISELNDAEDDPRVKAVLIRIDSPGGTVAASQEIAQAVAAMDKPVVASISDIGASGAYMVASQCDEIVALPTSSVGSIGVVLDVPNIEGLMDKVGVKVVVLTQGEFKDAGSPFRELTPEETKLLNAQMRIAYDEFIRMVAEGRDIPEAKVRKLATGWVWMGVEAKKLGLVDTLGGYTQAVDAAAELGGIEGEPDVVDFDRPELPFFLQALLSGANGSLLGGVADPRESLGLGQAVPR